MSYRAIVFSCFLLVLGGCASNNNLLPEIVYNPSPQPRVVPPKVVKVEKPKQENDIIDVPADWLPPSAVEKQWTAIVIHHSATETGNSAIFDKKHREENHWDGVGYDFVIGNGTDSGDGEVEVTFRWQKQIAGAHCGGTPGNWANIDAVGICLVGNFDYTTPSTRQMQSLLKLVRFLKKRYGISNSSIYGHKSTPGARVTDCPGQRFPIERVKWLAGS